MFSSTSCITEGGDDDIVKVSPLKHAAKSHTKKRPLPDDDEVIEVEAHGKRASLRSLYDDDSDDDVKGVSKKASKATKKKGETKVVVIKEEKR
jgi:hypothetical protein